MLDSDGTNTIQAKEGPFYMIAVKSLARKNACSNIFFYPNIVFSIRLKIV